MITSAEVHTEAIQCPMCPARLVYITEHLRDAHVMLDLEQLTLQNMPAAEAVRALEKSVTVGKLQLLWDSMPAIPMVLDFSQAEAPPDASRDEAGSPEPALVWVSLPQVTPAQTEEMNIQEILDELFPTFDGLAALWSPDDLEATIEENPPSHRDLPAVGATALAEVPEVDMSVLCL
ncbi:uncharacterized protein LOC143718558 [Siphateles boraxobius]|uniref:uncharacterized protein LOC143718558 n=1 Tax=Siphateles boraxobius TaxID=180520 RepID=UPI0040649467